MKTINKILIVAFILVGSMANAQISVQTNPEATISQENPFLDASKYNNFGANVGKGLYFPRTDLTTWTFKTNIITPASFSTYFDGMVVYNTATGQTVANTSQGGIQVAVTPGFYYFSNPDENITTPVSSVATGKWVRVEDTATNSAEWATDTINGNEKIYMIDAMSANDTIAYDKTNRRYEINLGGVDYTDANFLWEDGTTIGHVPTEIPNSISYSSDILPKETTFSKGGKRYSNIVALTKESHVSANTSTTKNYTLEECRSILSSDVVSDVATFENGIYSTGHHGMGKVDRLRSLTALTASGVGGGNVALNEAFASYARAYGGETKAIVGGSFEVINHGATVTDARGLYLGVHNFVNPANNTLGTIARAVGLEVKNITAGTTNYAIYTNQGDVSFLGNTGIGTRTPLNKLHVAGTVRWGLDADANHISSGANSDVSWIDFKTNNSTNKGNIGYRFDSDYLFINALNTSKNTVINPASGNVGIGTVTPTEKLEVNGNVKATTFIATASGSVFPDYVFEKYFNNTSKLKPTYTFKPLNEVERYIKANGRLPGYVSAKEVAQKGAFNMTEVQLTNVEKIEELYLHTIEQNKELKAQSEKLKVQQKEIEELKALVQQLLKNNN